ncbi:MAG: cytochrome c [Vicinamibacterales bacterium]
MAPVFPRFRPGRLLWLAGLVLSSVVVTSAARPGPDDAPVRQTTAGAARTTKDGVFTKEQAAAGQKVFEQYCTACHAFKPADDPGEGPDLAGEEFLGKWTGRSVRELQTTIFTTMPNDGSAVLTEEQTVQAVSWILQQNGFPPGTTALPYGAGASAITIQK